MPHRSHPAVASVSMHPRSRRRRDLIQTYMVANAFEWALAGQALVAALSFFAKPDEPNNAVEFAGPVLGYLWNGLYAVAGVTIIFGMLRLSPRFEAAGLILLIAALSVNVAALAAFHPSAWAFALYVVLVVALVMRIVLLAKVVAIVNAKA